MTLPRFLKGPEFVAWLKEQGVEYSSLSDSQKRRWWGWEQPGSRADVYSTVCDNLLTDHMLLNEIPDELWSEDQSNRRRKPQRGRLDEIRLHVAAGLTLDEIQQKTGLARSSVQKYLQKLNRERKNDEEAD